LQLSGELSRKYKTEIGRRTEDGRFYQGVPENSIGEQEAAVKKQRKEKFDFDILSIKEEAKI
jgi:hypothetical protein